MGTTTQVPTQRQFESITRHHKSHQSHSQRKQGQRQRQITPFTAITITGDRELITSIAVRGNKDKTIMLGGKLMVLNTTDQVILIITIYIMVMKVMGKLTQRTKKSSPPRTPCSKQFWPRYSHPIMTSRWRATSRSGSCRRWSGTRWPRGRSSSSLRIGWSGWLLRRGSTSCPTRLVGIMMMLVW